MAEKTEYRVLVREVQIRTVLVDASSEDEAKELVFHGEGDIMNVEYSHDLDSSTWTVEEV